MNLRLYPNSFSPSYPSQLSLCDNPFAPVVTRNTDLLLYDVSGRVVAEVSQEFPTGTHSVIFGDLAEGVYFCTMEVGDFSVTETVVVSE